MGFGNSMLCFEFFLLLSSRRRHIQQHLQQMSILNTNKNTTKLTNIANRINKLQLLSGLLNKLDVIDAKKFKLFDRNFFPYNFY